LDQALTGRFAQQWYVVRQSKSTHFTETEDEYEEDRIDGRTKIVDEIIHNFDY